MSEACNGGCQHGEGSDVEHGGGRALPVFRGVCNRRKLLGMKYAYRALHEDGMTDGRAMCEPNWQGGVCCRCNRARCCCGRLDREPGS